MPARRPVIERRDAPMAITATWAEAHCVVPDRHRAGEPLRLYDYQLAYFSNFYLVKGTAVYDPVDPVLGPAFVYRRGILVGPQKLGKSPHSAVHICIEAVGPALFAGWASGGEVYECYDHGCGCGWSYVYEAGEPMGAQWATPLIQVTASSHEQTDNIYAALRPMIEMGPLGDVIRNIGEEFTRLPGGGRIDTVTSSAKARLGQRVTFIPQDEAGLWTPADGMGKPDGVAARQYRGLAGMGGRASITTNPWDPAENSIAQRLYDSKATDLYRQFHRAPPHLSYGNKRERRRIHQVVYGDTLRERGGHVDLDSIEGEAFDLLEHDPALAERYYGNRLMFGKGSWLPKGLWEATETDVDVPDGTQIACGFDGSESDDWTAIRAETIDGHRFTPTYGPDDRPTFWDPAEWGGSIPRGEVAAAWDELHTRYRVARSYNDPRDWQSEIGDRALRYGTEVVMEWATYRITAMHDALERAVTDLVSRRSTHDRCPATALSVANARKIAKPGQRYILGKPAQHQKIDLAMADVLAHEAAADAHAAGWGLPPEPDPYTGSHVMYGFA